MVTILILETLALPWAVLIEGQQYQMEKLQAHALIASGLAREVKTNQTTQAQTVTTKKNEGRKC